MASTPLRVAHLIDTLSWGGAQKLLVTFAEAAGAHNIVPTVISLRALNDSPFAQHLTELGVPVIVLPCRRIFEPQQIWELIQFLRQGRFDVLHSHLTQANIIGGIVGRLLGIPVVSSVHNTKIRVRRNHKLRQAVETAVLRHGAKRVIAVGHVVAEIQQRQLGGKRIYTIPNAVASIPPLPLDERTALRRSILGDPSRTMLIAVGRLTAQKGYHDLLTAFALLRATHPSSALVIVGRGDLQAELVERVTNLGLDGHVFLLGARTDVPRLLAVSDVFVSTSHWEGLPVAVLEGMAAGLPVVATAVGDVPRVVVEGTGFVTPPGDPEAFAAALRTLLDDPILLQSLGAKAYAHVAQDYSATAWLDQLLTLYNDISGRSVAVA